MPERPEVPIRTATRDDAAALVQLEREAEGAAHWSIGEYWRIFDSEAPPRTVLIAGGSPPVGFLIARIAGLDWEIENVAVVTLARRRGIGTALLRELLRQARRAGASNVTLEVRESNQPARSLYESCGFSAVARRPGYYHDPPEDALIYRIVLESRP
jgi:ribosomal-protein-alanine N-acetyltransferase